MSDKYPGGFVTAGAPAGFSVAFDGTGDYLSTPSATALQLTAATAFTIEAWAYPTSFPNTDHGIIGKRGGTTEWQFFFKNDKTLHLYTGLGDYGSGTAISGVNQWVHCAVTWDLTTLRFFINGVLCSTTHTGILFNIPSTADVTIGADYAGAELWYGYLSNVRLVKGTALYTTTFTPPTQLFPITNTSLLACQSPTIIDNSTNALTITANGDAKVSNFTPFAGYTGFNPALGAAAGGVWTLDEAAYYQQNRLWPIYDPYFKNTTLMLHGNGTNGAQNNTFLDSSSNNFTITRNGNTTQGSFSPFSQTGWSNYFASSSGVRFPDSTAFSMGSNPFTIECWVYITKTQSAGVGFINQWLSGNDSNSSWQLGVDWNGGSGGDKFAGQISIGGSVTTFNDPNSYSLNVWTHIAFVRSGNVFTLYVNGVSKASSTVSGSLIDASNPVGIGIRGGSNDYYADGVYISNARVVNGTAVYTSNFTPSAQPLTAIQNTSLLTCQNNRFVDNSSLNATATASGTPTVQAFSPFVPAYITPTTYSNYFNGSSSYLSVASSALDVPSSTNFTIEGWVYLNAHTNNQPCIFNNYTSSGGLALFAGHNSFDGNLFNLLIAGSIYSGGTIVYGQWTHFAVVRNGTGSGNVSLYINGISVLSTISTNAAITYIGQVSIGTAGDSTSAGAINGCISNFRWNTTTAVYTAAFTPPTAPLTAISGTQLLTCQNSTFIDNSTNNLTLTAAGTVQPVTSPTPFPAKVDTTTLNSAYSTSLIGGSAYFDGSGDYLQFTDTSNNLDLGGLQASFDAWVYVTSTSNGILLNKSNSSIGGWSDIEYQIYPYETGQFTFVYNVSNSATTLRGGAIGLNQWAHICVATDASNNIAMFLNGVRVATATNAITKPTTRTSMFVGSQTGGAGPFPGYVSSMRFIKGSGAYDPTKTVIAITTAPPTDTATTQLLLNYTNGAIFDNTAKNVLETAGGAALSSTQAKYGTTSMYFDGTGDWLIAANGKNYINGTEPFTIECWVYITGTPAYWSICGAGSGTLVLTIQNLTTININPYGSGNTVSATTSLSINTWTHIAATRNSGNRFDIWVNGVSAGNATSSQSFGSPTYYAIGAADSSTTQPFIGYLDDVRITKACRYFGTFTPPTSQLQDQ